MSKLYKYKCKYCGKEYVSYKEKSNYCSHECRIKANEFFHDCDYCGKPIKIKKVKYDKYMNGEIKNLYCSKECADKAHTKKVKNICEYCGKEYEICNAFKDIQKFCSRECYENSRKLMIRTCPMCHNEYQPTRKGQIYCSRRCSGRASQLDKIDCLELNENGLLYVSGYDDRRNGYFGLINFVRSRLCIWKDHIREENNFTCALSGSRSNIIVHHIRSFNLLFEETIQILNFPICDNYSDYTDEQLNLFIDTFMSLQEQYHAYVCITECIHKLFHKEYGYGYNTQEQWNEFVERYNNHYYENVS